jgi:adhesin/invasin
MSNPRVIAPIALIFAVGSCQDATLSAPSVKDPLVFAAKLVSVTGTALTGQANRALAPVVLRVVDAGGSPVKGATVRFEVRTGGGSITPTAAVSATDGTVSATWTLGTTVGSQSTMALLATQHPVDSLLVTANATTGPANRLRWIRGGAAGTQLQRDTTGGTSVDTMEVQLYDSLGGQLVGVAGVPVTWTTTAPTGTDGQPVNSTTVTDVNGKARTVWMFRDNFGLAIPPSSIAKRMLATVAGVGQVEFQARVHPGKASVLGLAFSNGGLTAGATTNILATVSDISGYPISGAVVTFSVGTGYLVTPGVQTASATTGTDGVATIAWVLGTAAGLQTVTASSTVTATPYSVTSTVAASKTVTPAPPTVTIVAGNGQTVTAGNTVPVNPKVKVTDGSGNGIAGVPVDFVVLTGGGSVSAAQVLSDASGFASVTWTLGANSGSNTLSASTSGGTAAVFTATGAPPVIVKNAGDGVTAAAGASVAVQVKVTDSNGVALSGRTVTFSVASGGGSVSSATVTTDVNGLATVSWTLGAVAGANTLTASAGGTSVTFTATGT